MADNEINSFVQKFKLLRDAGLEASLSLETKLGEVEISLSCKVGRILPPPQSPSSSSRYRSPSYYRRQARRKAQRDLMNNIVGEVPAEIVGETAANSFEAADEIHVTDDEVDEYAEEIPQVRDKPIEEKDNIEDENISSDNQDLGEKLKALIEESKKNRERWNRFGDSLENG